MARAWLHSVVLHCFIRDSFGVPWGVPLVPRRLCVPPFAKSVLCSTRVCALT